MATSAGYNALLVVSPELDLDVGPGRPAVFAAAGPNARAIGLRALLGRPRDLRTPTVPCVGFFFERVVRREIDREGMEAADWDGGYRG